MSTYRGAATRPTSAPANPTALEAPEPPAVALHAHSMAGAVDDHPGCAGTTGQPPDRWRGRR
jgi:hypothetical protein